MNLDIQINTNLFRLTESNCRLNNRAQTSRSVGTSHLLDLVEFFEEGVVDAGDGVEFELLELVGRDAARQRAGVVLHRGAAAAAARVVQI